MTGIYERRVEHQNAIDLAAHRARLDGHDGMFKDMKDEFKMVNEKLDIISDNLSQRKGAAAFGKLIFGSILTAIGFIAGKGDAH